MEKEFVTYEQAVALKELGFDEPCIFFYIDRQNWGVLGQAGYYNNGFSWCNENQFTFAENKNMRQSITRPTYSQAFRWFREECHLWSEIKVEDSVKIGDHTFYWSIFGGHQTFKDTLMIRCLTDSDVDGKVYKTYEESESECLDKLIEIVNDSK